MHIPTLRHCHTIMDNSREFISPSTSTAPSPCTTKNDSLNKSTKESRFNLHAARPKFFLTFGGGVTLCVRCVAVSIR
ncbi:hypothetical protein PsorP6_002352 [Peronosclerospora sorghi]|uniref:Uncharacterized protein n=1 Tax=Peronosclerospora sorghi TaxID=230839 RepID=A0ACC0WVK8_9STRA|nr:hypothetical protein PsorP6_002352 [Peronosclerospora sorghi]